MSARWADSVEPAHISTVPTDAHTGGKGTGAMSCEPHGLCVCSPRPESSPVGECPSCHRLDPAKVSPRCGPFPEPMRIVSLPDSILERLRSEYGARWGL